MAPAQSSVFPSHFVRNKYGDLILHDPTTRVPVAFTAMQARAFSRFDDLLRRESGSTTSMQYYPGGYESFVELWDADPACTYGFAKFNPRDGTCVLSSRPAIREDVLAPLPASKVIRTGIDLPQVGMQTVIRSLAESQTRSYQARDRVESKWTGRAGKKPRYYHSTTPIGHHVPVTQSFCFSSTPEPRVVSTSPTTPTTPIPSTANPTPSSTNTASRQADKGNSTRIDEDNLIAYDFDKDLEGANEEDETMIEGRAA
ncbi:hypothetical protein CERSUDRAFT_127790 [Gelatoporia subvermispora B]|uniref:Uncharacterized protein n=1 Tax=Ceriporiopsis subvermispora (strain B) TaxID=914234 RepID=M2QVK8_CERS8|nr:hypothetical protein CERSUDRAFT_127790 [Gelatoporia subvermispora B]